MLLPTAGVAGWCPVAMQDGQTVPLQDVKKGDRVACSGTTSATVQCAVRFCGPKTMLVQVNDLHVTPLFPKIRNKPLCRFWVHPQDCVDTTQYRKPIYSTTVYNLVLDGEQHEMTVAGMQCMTLHGSAAQQLRAANPAAWKACLVCLPLSRSFASAL